MPITNAEHELAITRQKMKKLLSAIERLRRHADLILSQPWLVDDIMDECADIHNVYNAQESKD
jgi:hypothetical protein